MQQCSIYVTNIGFKQLNGHDIAESFNYSDLDDLGQYIINRSSTIPTASSTTADFVEVSSLLYYKHYDGSSYDYLPMAEQAWVSNNFLGTGTTYATIGAASAEHTHDGRYLSTSANVISVLGYTPLSSYTDTNQKVKAGTVTFGDNDVINFVGGGDVTVTGNSTNKSITISYTAPASLPANGGNASSLAGQAATYYASAGLISSLDYASVGALSSGTTIPTVYNSTLTIKVNNTAAGTFTANASSDSTINITVPTDYASVNALSAGTAIPSVYGDVGAASAAHTHTYSDVGAASAGHTHTYSDVGAASAGHDHSGVYLPDGSYYAGALLISPNSYTSGTQQLQSLYTTDAYVSSTLWLSPVDSMYSDTGDADGIHIGTSISGRYLSIEYSYITVHGSFYANMAYVNGSQVKTAAFYDSTAFASSGHTHDYIPLSGTASLSGNLIPTVNTVNLGNSNKPFGAVYANNVYGLSLVSASTLNLAGDYVHKMYYHNVKVVASVANGNSSFARCMIQIFSTTSSSFTNMASLSAAMTAIGFTNSSHMAMCTGGAYGSYRMMGAFIASNKLYFAVASNTNNSAVTLYSVYNMNTIKEFYDAPFPLF